MSHLLTVISGHGYGHAMQACAVLEALHGQRPDIRFSIRTQVPEAFLRSRLAAPFKYIHAAVDFGMVMHSATDVDVAASARQYRAIHAAWTSHLEAEARCLAELQTDLLFADIPYLSLAAAARLGIPSVALCSLNWADIYHHYCHDSPADAEIHATMQAAYRSAAVFLQPAPNMPMADLPQRQALDPIAASGQAQAAALRRSLNCAATTKLVLVGLGGIPTQLPMHNWPQRDDVVWLIPASWQVQRPDCIAFERVSWRYIDILASVDALLTKPGYGSFTEAAYHGVAVVYLSRADWPESAYLQTWLHQHNRCAEIQPQDLSSDTLLAQLDSLWMQEPPPRPSAEGAVQAAQVLAKYFPTDVAGA